MLSGLDGEIITHLAASVIRAVAVTQSLKVRWRIDSQLEDKIVLHEYGVGYGCVSR